MNVYIKCAALSPSLFSISPHLSLPLSLSPPSLSHPVFSISPPCLFLLHGNIMLWPSACPNEFSMCGLSRP